MVYKETRLVTQVHRAGKRERERERERKRQTDRRETETEVSMSTSKENEKALRETQTLRAGCSKA